MTSTPASRGSDSQSRVYKSDSQIIHEHLAQMCKYRGATVTSTIITDPAQFAVTMETNHFVQITATRTADDIRGAANIVVIQFSVVRHIDASSPKFSAFLEKLIKTRPPGDIEFNIILVTSAAVSSAIDKIIASPHGRGVVVEQYEATKFLLVVPEHSIVPRHSIVAPADVEQICNRMHITLKNIPTITSSDPVSIWMGFRPGMLIRIDRYSETAGREIVYRHCV